MAETTHICSSAAKIDGLERELERVRNTTAEDHDLLMTIKVQVGMVLVEVNKLASELNKINSQPSARYERLKIVFFSAIVASVGTYVATWIINKL